MMNHDRGVSGFDGIFAVAGFLIAAAVIVPIFLIGLIGKLATKRIQLPAWKRPDKEGAPTEAEHAAATTADQEPLLHEEPAPVVSSHEMEPATELSTIIAVDGPDGTAVHLRVYREAGVVKRRARMATQHQPQFGRTVDLGDVPICPDMQRIKDEAIAAVQSVLTTGKKVPAPSPESAVTASVTSGNPEKALDNGNKEIAEPTAEPSDQKESPRKKLTTSRGYIVRWGREERTDVDSPYTAFCLTLLSEALGTQEQLWGADLSRALKAVGAVKGDLIEANHVGYTPTIVEGEQRSKKSWSIKIIKKGT